MEKCEDKECKWHNTSKENSCALISDIQNCKDVKQYVQEAISEGRI